jgi:hypothetical protein
MVSTHDVCTARLAVRTPPTNSPAPAKQAILIFGRAGFQIGFPLCASGERDKIQRQVLYPFVFSYTSLLSLGKMRAHVSQQPLLEWRELAFVSMHARTRGQAKIGP